MISIEIGAIKYIRETMLKRFVYLLYKVQPYSLRSTLYTVAQTNQHLDLSVCYCIAGV